MREFRVQKMSTEKIERLAVGAIEIEADKPFSLLKPMIPKGDKDISYDGEIQVFKSEKETVKTLSGKVPVQVKGTQVEELSAGKRSFSLEMEHYHNYYHNGGVLFLVVEITEDNDKKIFYKHLLSKELHKIIMDYGHQKSKSMELRPLEETSLYDVCVKFINEREKQPKIIIENSDIEDNEFTSYSVSSLTYDPNNEATSYIFEHDFTFYGEKGGVAFPLHHGRVHAVLKEYEEFISIDGKLYRFDVQAKEEPSKTTLFIENSLLIELVDSNNGLNVNIKMIRFHSLYIQLKILPFLIHLLHGEKVHFTITSVNLLKSHNDHNTFIRALQQTNSMLLKLKRIFRNMGVDEKKEVGKEGDNYDQIIKSLSTLVNAVFKKDFTKLNFKDQDFAGFIKLSLGEIRLLLFYDPTDKGNLLNAFSEDLLSMYIFGQIDKDSTQITRHSPYTALESDFAEMDNVNFDIIKKSFDKFDPFESESVFSRTNYFWLQCLNAYDTSKNKQILNLVEYIYSKYNLNSNLKINQNIILINRLQTNIRKVNILSDEEYKELIKLKNNPLEDIQVRFCASVLTESKREADIYFDELENDMKIFYKNLPIYTLYQNLINQ